MQINTGSPLEHHWVLASASVVPVASQCTCGSSGLPVWSVLWYRSVLTESGLEVIRSGHFTACDPLCIQLVWWKLFELNWFPLTCNPKYTKIMCLVTGTMVAVVCYQSFWFGTRTSDVWYRNIAFREQYVTETSLKLHTPVLHFIGHRPIHKLRVKIKYDRTVCTPNIGALGLVVW